MWGCAQALGLWDLTLANLMGSVLWPTSKLQCWLVCSGLATALWQIFDAHNTLSMPGKATRAVSCLVAGAAVPSHEAAGPSQSSASRRRHGSCSWSGRGGRHACGGGPAVMTSRRSADCSEPLASTHADVAPQTSSEDLNTIRALS